MSDPTASSTATWSGSNSVRLTPCTAAANVHGPAGFVPRVKVAAISTPSNLPVKVKSFPCRDRLNLPQRDSQLVLAANIQVNLLQVWIDAIAGLGYVQREARVQREVFAID